MEFVSKIVEGFLNEVGAKILVAILLALATIFGLRKRRQIGRLNQQRQQAGTGARQFQSAQGDSGVSQEQIAEDHAWQIQKAGDKDA